MESLQKASLRLDLVLSNPVLSGATVRYDLKKPFVMLSEMSQKQDWRTHCEELRKSVSDSLVLTFCRLPAGQNIKAFATTIF
jgi:hypothetical protein